MSNTEAEPSSDKSLTAIYLIALFVGIGIFSFFRFLSVYGAPQNTEEPITMEFHHVDGLNIRKGENCRVYANDSVLSVSFRGEAKVIHAEQLIGVSTNNETLTQSEKYKSSYWGVRGFNSRGTVYIGPKTETKIKNSYTYLNFIIITFRDINGVTRLIELSTTNNQLGVASLEKKIRILSSIKRLEPMTPKLARVDDNIELVSFFPIGAGNLIPDQENSRIMLVCVLRMILANRQFLEFSKNQYDLLPKYVGTEKMPELSKKTSEIIDEQLIYQPMMYKIGYDIPAGEYKVFRNGGNYCNFSVTNSCRVNAKIVTNGFVESSAYVTVADNQYLTVSDGIFTSLDNCSPSSPKKRIKSAHMLKVGRDILQGEYSLTPCNKNDSHYAIKKNSATNNTLIFNYLQGRTYIEVQDGQYLVVKNVLLERIQ